MAKKARRGSKMGKGTSNSRKSRKTGKKYLSIPDKWSLYKADPGLIKMDILPYVVGDPKKHPEFENMADDVWYRFPYMIHNSVGPNREAVLCPGTIGKACPICDQKQAIYDDPDADNKAASKFRASYRSLFLIKIKGGDDTKNKGKKFIWDMSDFCFFDQVDTELEHGEEEWNNFACLEGGYTLKVRLLEEAFDGNKFPKCDRIDFVARKNYKESLLDSLPCLDDIIVPNIKSFKDIEDILEGVDEDEDEDTSKKSKKTKSKKAAKKTKKAVKKKSKPKPPSWDDLEDMDEEQMEELVEEFDLDLEDYEDEDELRDLLIEGFDLEPPEDEDEDEDDDEEEDDEDDNEDEDEDEDEDDEDEEEDEPEPKKKKAKSKSKKVVKKSKSKKSKSSKKKKGTKTTKNALKCPFAYDFGADFGEHSECNEDDCKKHDDCFEKYDELMDEE